MRFYIFIYIYIYLLHKSVLHCVNIHIYDFKYNNAINVRLNMLNLYVYNLHITFEL